jgi:hypothetical protein
MGEPPKPRVRRPSAFRQLDVTRAIKAAKGGGLAITRIEIEPDTPKITLVMKDDTATETTTTNPFDVAAVEEPTLRRRTRKTKHHGSQN